MTKMYSSRGSLNSDLLKIVPHPVKILNGRTMYIVKVARTQNPSYSRVYILRGRVARITIDYRIRWPSFYCASHYMPLARF